MGFFRELGVDTEESDMSFALSTPDVEWGSRGLSAIFAQPGLWHSPKFLLMIWEVIAFGRQAPEVLADARWEGVSLGEYLKQRRYSEFFCTHYVTPMCAPVTVPLCPLCALSASCLHPLHPRQVRGYLVVLGGRRARVSRGEHDPLLGQPPLA